MHAWLLVFANEFCFINFCFLPLWRICDHSLLIFLYFEKNEEKNFVTYWNHQSCASIHLKWTAEYKMCRLSVKGKYDMSKNWKMVVNEFKLYLTICFMYWKKNKNELWINKLFLSYYFCLHLLHLYVNFVNWFISNSHILNVGGKCWIQIKIHVPNWTCPPLV